MFVYGTQYLRGFSPERDQWEKDMENMKKLGFNTIRAWFVWNAIERREGEIDKQYIHDFLGLAKKYDLQVGILFHLHACPAWAVKKYPQYFYVNEDNIPFEPAVRANTPSSGWPGLCFDHPEVREMEERFITAVIAETKQYDNVAFYEPMNEPHQWVDFKKRPSGIFCYCPATVQKYQSWLQKKYGDIETLNNAWGYFYDNFSEVRPPRWTSSFCDYIDFRQFEVDSIAEEIAFRAEIIRKCDNKPVIAHAWGGGSTTCVQLGGMAFDDWKNAKVFDKWGYSAFPSTAEDCTIIGLGCDTTRCAAGGKEYWQSELTAGLNNGLFQHKGRVDGKTWDKFTLESIRHGAEGLLFWQYRRERIGMELGGCAMADYDGGPTPLIEKAGELGQMLGKYGYLFKTTQAAPAKVGLVFSIRSYFADWSANSKIGNKTAVDSMSGYYRMFWEENIPVDIVHEEFGEHLEQYDILILPSAMAISPAFAERLKQYVYRGGTLLSEQMFGGFDPTFKLSYTMPGYGFDQILGVKQDELVPCAQVELQGENGVLTLTGNKYKETYKNVSAQVLYRYADGSPAIVCNAYGKGKAYLTGVNLGLAYSSGALVSDDFTSDDKANSSTAAKDFVLSRCTACGIDGNLCSAKDVKVSVRENENEALLIAINSAPKAKTGTITLPAAYGVADLIYGKADIALAGNALTFAVDADQSFVLHLQK